jgi:hypothetical protein
MHLAIEPCNRASIVVGWGSEDKARTARAAIPLIHADN